MLVGVLAQESDEVGDIRGDGGLQRHAVELGGMDELQAESVEGLALDQRLVGFRILRAQGESLIQGADAARISFPEFFTTLEGLLER